MTDFIVPCDTLVRLSKIVIGAPDGFDTIRFESGCVIVTNRALMAIEHIGSNPGVTHIKLDADLLAVCETEAKYSSNVTITANDMLQYTIAKTTLGYVSGNIGNFAPPPDLHRWKEVLKEAETIPDKGNGGMFWAAEHIAQLAACSPSGRVTFAENIDAYRNTVIRDVTDGEWLGIFSPKPNDGYAPWGATVPAWARSL